MKILIVSNLYPPYYVGGYELRCSQVASHLHKAGHQLRVLTTTFGVENDENGAGHRNELVSGIPVERSLRYRPAEPSTIGFHVPTMASRQLPDARRFVQILDEFRPDLVNWWNLEGVTKAILPAPAARGIPDVCCIDDSWLIREYGLHAENENMDWFRFWRGDWGPRLLRPVVRSILGPLEHKIGREGIPTRPLSSLPRHVCFVSEFMRFQHAKAGLIFPSSDVIYGGVVPADFYCERRLSDFVDTKIRFLYVGYIGPERGLLTIVEALGLLPLDLRDRLELSIAHSGPPTPTPYVREVQSRIEQLGLSNTVKFLGRHQHSEMPLVYQNHHALVFASSREEGLPMTMMEAMCAGCAVVTTGSGGAIELGDFADLAIFPKDHPVALSRLIASLVQDPQLLFQIGQRGQNVVLHNFTFDRMMEAFCARFHALCGERETKPETHAPVLT